FQRQQPIRLEARRPIRLQPPHNLLPLPLPLPLQHGILPLEHPSDNRLIAIVVIFTVLPIICIWFCCHRKQYSCLRREEKRQHYNAAYPTQISGGVFLVPVNQFVPPEHKMGYAVRVDTPANPTEAAPPAPPVQHQVIMPERAASPP